MGSNRERKKKDQPLIRRPPNVISQEAKDSSASNTGKEFAADMCPLAFESLIKATEMTLINGMGVTLIKKGELYCFYINGIELGILNRKQSDVISNCQAIGINYSGSIAEEKEKFYARFSRIT